MNLYKYVFTHFLICSSSSSFDVLIYLPSSSTDSREREFFFCGFYFKHTQKIQKETRTLKNFKKASLICCTTNSLLLEVRKKKTARAFISHFIVALLPLHPQQREVVHDVVVVVSFFLTPIVLWFYFISWIFIAYYTTSSDCGRKIFFVSCAVPQFLIFSSSSSQSQSIKLRHSFSLIKFLILFDLIEKVSIFSNLFFSLSRSLVRFVVQLFLEFFFPVKWLNESKVSLIRSVLTKDSKGQTSIFIPKNKLLDHERRVYSNWLSKKNRRWRKKWRELKV